MDTDRLNECIKIRQKIDIINNYIKKFDPDDYVVWLRTSDHFGNIGKILDLYAHEDNNAITLEYDNFTKYYKEFLKKCTHDLILRKTELLNQFKKL